MKARSKGKSISYSYILFFFTFLKTNLPFALWAARGITVKEINNDSLYPCSFLLLSTSRASS